ncbi:MAG: polysaccharide deacetylase family protein [Paludisphaera borealis]|uniref:polysaccharide deacetylase family protein n=1 Tax=Paludisphaera borealis TaxID=1387353 RepID=UPI00283DB945|nr:polysaccharide deacetylase family protein [Paludisphaera borealis]MDR3619551.1 polysaccharide deacetylase family protein [Paludisphaera borealis]
MPARLFQSIPNKRDFLARSLSASGGLRLLERLAEARRTLVVLTYHRIATRGGKADPYYDPVISATPEGFRDQMRMVRDRFEVVRPEDLAGGATVPNGRKPLAMVTFDDGYRDNHDAALPILQELEIPATFFIPTDFFERPRLPWWDHVAYCLKTTSSPRLVLKRTDDDASPLTIELGADATPDARTEAIMRVIRAVLAGEVPDQSGFLARLEAQSEVAVDSPALGRDLFMSWEHLKRLAALGHTIGSHGHGHVALATLPDSLQRREFALSRTILEAAVGRPVKTVAYPYGWPGAFTSRTIELAADAGYTLGFTALEGINHPDALDFASLALRRLNIGAGDTPALLRGRAALHGALGKSWL